MRELKNSRKFKPQLESYKKKKSMNLKTDFMKLAS